MNTKIDSPRPVFMETTTAINRHFGMRTQRDFVSQASTGRRVITCTFVQFEYKRVVQRACVEFHRLLASIGDTDEAFRAFGQSYSVSQLSIGYALLVPIIRDLDDDISRILEELEWLIEEDLLVMFRMKIDKITDATRCALAYQQPVRQGNTYAPGFLQVSRERFDCDLPAFIEHNRDAFQTVYDVLSVQRSSHTRRLRQVLSRVLNVPAESKGRNALTLGDAIIAVEMPKDALLLTTNRRDFEPICAALGKDIFKAEFVA